MNNQSTNRHNLVLLNPAPRVIGIVGGKYGQMGALLERAFTKTGYKVITTGIRSNEQVEPKVMRRLNHGLLRASDVVIIATPTPEVEKGLEHLFGSRALRGLRGKLIFDICSVKSQPMHVMATAAGASIIGTHPFFGPAIQQIQGKNVILCPLDRNARVLNENTKAWVAWLASWWRSQGANVHFMTPEEHDQLAAVAQTGVVAATYLFAKAVQALGIPLSILEEVFTPNSLILQTLMGRMLNPAMVDTYANLATGNQFSPAVTMAIRDAAEAFHMDVISRNAAAIGIRLHSLAAGISPDFRAKAMALSKEFERVALHKEDNANAMRQKSA